MSLKQSENTLAKQKKKVLSTTEQADIERKKVLKALNIKYSSIFNDQQKKKERKKEGKKDLL